MVILGGLGEKYQSSDITSAHLIKFKEGEMNVSSHSFQLSDALPYSAIAESLLITLSLLRCDLQ